MVTLPSVDGNPWLLRTWQTSPSDDDDDDDDEEGSVDALFPSCVKQVRASFSLAHVSTGSLVGLTSLRYYPSSRNEIV